ncbi:MAG: hypothetical protein HDS00_05605 [Bacteroides sp.]|nr:hypothetical protein [Bacteroides sp.]
MLRLDRICIVLFIITLAMLIPVARFVGWAGSLLTFVFAGIAIADSVVNRHWRRYSLLWIIMGIMTAYALYSLFLPYNNPAAIASDWIIQQKPFIPFVVMMAVKPSFRPSDRVVVKLVSVVNVVLTLVVWSLGPKAVEQVMQHISYVGLTIFTSALAFYLASIEPTGKIDRRSLFVTILMILAGLVCGRSKYFGSAVFAIFMMIFYSPDMFQRYNKRAIAMFAIALSLVTIVGWQKFEFYFIGGQGIEMDTGRLATIARPMMYYTGALILIDHLPFGSGLASFATHPSAKSYSSIYFDYHLDKVWGLGPSMPEFITDAYYPSLAQFGIVGVGLFIWFWVYVARLLRSVIRSAEPQRRALFTLGWVIIVFLMIENIANTTLVQGSGLCTMMMLGLVCSHSQLATPTNDNSTTPTTYGSKQ